MYARRSITVQFVGKIAENVKDNCTRRVTKRQVEAMESLSQPTNQLTK